jgi:transcriptional regulator with XRE-family HTH domain
VRSSKEFREKYNCTIVEFAGLLGVTVSTAQKWSGDESMVSSWHQNQIELLDQTFSILSDAERSADFLKSHLCDSRLAFYLNWRRRSDN